VEVRALLFLIVLYQTCGLPSPLIVTYVDSLDKWWPPTAIAGGIGVPGYGVNSSFNVFNMAFWTTGGPADVAELWGNALHYVSSDNPWGSTTQQIQSAWVGKFHAKGIKVMVSAFGATNYPTGDDPIQVANNLAAFVKNNQLDGCDVDYEDNDAMNQGRAEAWLISFTQQLRKQLPREQGYIISHAPQAPYFLGKPNYPNGAYITIDQAVGNLIDFYNVQFYNQGSSDYTTYQTLFQQADGWSPNTAVFQIHSKGIPLERIVVGKPITQADADNTGYVPMDQLQGIISQAARSTSWRTGVMGWEFVHDNNGDWSKKMASAFN